MCYTLYVLIHRLFKKIKLADKHNITNLNETNYANKIVAIYKRHDSDGNKYRGIAELFRGRDLKSCKSITGGNGQIINLCKFWRKKN